MHNTSILYINILHFKVPSSIPLTKNSQYIVTRNILNECKMLLSECGIVWRVDNCVIACVEVYTHYSKCSSCI